MDPELRQYLDTKFARIDQRFTELEGSDVRFRTIDERFTVLERHVIARLEKFE